MPGEDEAAGAARPHGASEREGERAAEQARPAAVMADVARLAGVSAMTVSRVLNDHRSVRAETRERVLAAVAELDYRRNSAARTLATRRSQTVGVVAFDTTFYGQAACVRGVEHAAREAGYFVSIATVKVVEEHSLREATDSLAAQSVDGLVVVTPSASVLQELRDRGVGVPMVIAGGSPDSGLPTASVDQVAGARLATRHLLSRGHRTVWHVAGPDDWDDSRPAGRLAIRPRRSRGEGCRPCSGVTGAPPPAGGRGRSWHAGGS